MKTSKHKVMRSHAGFSLLELMISCAVLLIVLGSVFRYIAVATQRSQSEQTKMDLTQEAREFVDEFERDIHQAGYPNCRSFNTGPTGSNCPGYFGDSRIASGLVYVSNTELVFEGDMDGDGTVDTVWYQLVDSAGNYPPTGTCPCTIKRSQMPKLNGVAPLSLAYDNNTTFSQELQNVVNSGVPASGSVYGNGLPIAGNTAWGTSDTSYYAAVTTFKDYPVFSAYDQDGFPKDLPLDITTASGILDVSKVKSIRLTINLLANANNGYDLKTHIRPVMTLVGTGRITNCYYLPCN